MENDLLLQYKGNNTSSEAPSTLGILQQFLAATGLDTRSRDLRGASSFAAPYRKTPLLRLTYPATVC